MSTKSVIAEIAANVRKEIKATLPGIKTSVRSKSYTGGRSITVTITDMDGAQIMTDEYVRHMVANERYNGAGWMTYKAKQVKDTITAILDSHNHTDGSYQRFFGFIGFSEDLKDAECDAMRKTIAAEKADDFTGDVYEAADPYADALNHFINNL